MDLTISIDGPTASGKTTLGVALCRVLGGAFLDTGLTYRALALAVSQDGLRPESASLETFLEHQPMVHATPGSGADSGPPQPERVVYQGTDITRLIFASILEPSLRAVAGNPRWRSQVLAMHRRIATAHRRMIAVGRDVATDLLTDATLHVFLNANQAVRRERRRAQYRDVTGRSLAVGPATELDLSSRGEIRSRANGVDIDTTYLPATAVQRCVLHKLHVLRRLAHV